MHSIISLALAFSLPHQPPGPPPFLMEQSQKMMRYYQAPDPSLGPKVLKDMLKTENIEHPFFGARQEVLVIIGSQLGDIAVGKPQIVRQYEAAFADAAPNGRRIIARALMNCGDKETLKQIDVWMADPKLAEHRADLVTLKKFLGDPQRKGVRDRPAQVPLDLDLLWANFFTTGEYIPVARILDVFDLPDSPQNAVLQRVGRWSMGSNLQSHPKLVELVQQNVKNRPDASRKVAEELLAPFAKVDSKEVEKLKALVVGKWLSDDGSKNPLEFGKDGAAKVGFIEEDGKWVFAVGTYQITHQGKLRSQTEYKGSMLTQTWTIKDGMLRGSLGPNPNVTWKKVGDVSGNK